MAPMRLLLGMVSSAMAVQNHFHHPNVVRKNKNAPQGSGSCKPRIYDRAKEDFDYLEMTMEWQDWELEIVDSNTSWKSCKVREKPGKTRMVIDYDGWHNDYTLECAEGLNFRDVKNQTTCRLNKTVEGAITSNGSFQGEKGPGVLYDLSMPDACKKGGAAVPCPFVVGLPGATNEEVHYAALKYKNCWKQQRAILLMIKIDHDADNSKYCGFEDTEFLRPLIQKFTSDYADVIDPERVILYGQSMGANAAMWGALRHPDLFTHVYPTSPHSFWAYWKKEDLEGFSDKCMNKGTDSWNKFEEVLEVGLPIWKERLKNKKLKQVKMYLGALDHKPHTADFRKLPALWNSFGLAEAGIDAEWRIFHHMAHNVWATVFNDLYDFVWHPEK